MTESASTTNRVLLEREARHAPGLWNPGIAFVRGEGIYIWDADGNRYYDCMAGIAVASLGHGHPGLVRALSNQASRLIIASQSFGNDTRTEFLEELFSFVKPPLQRAFMASSGSEVNEAALKWARAATGRNHFVAARKGFAGRTMGALSLTWEAKYREPFMPTGTPVTFVDFNDPAALEAAITDETAAVLLEPLQGEGGIHEATVDFVSTARRVSRERGALLVIDEIQTGAGRTGSFLASETWPVEPDMVTLAKGLGGGVPIAVLLMTDAVARAMPAGGHGTTFGGNALASAAGLAVLREIRAASLLEHVADVGSYFREQLAALDADKVSAVRGRGLLIGLELREPAAPFIAALLENGVLTVGAGSHVVRFLPPLIITREQVDGIVAVVKDTLAGL